MATLRVSNEVLTVFNGLDILAFNFENEKLHRLKSLSTSKSNTSTDPYLGLTRFCAAMSLDGKLYAVAESRNLIVWSIPDWNQKYCSKVLERSASKMVFTPSNQHILVADKTGDVYSYSLSSTDPKGTLLLGHLSILLDICITPNEKYIITCDRDEKIRVTCYPNTYNIKQFCLGHAAFVTRILLVSDDILLSSSGDGTVKFWHFETGKCLSSHSVGHDLSGKVKEPCIITDMQLCTSNSSIVCLLVHKFDGILVYNCSNLNMRYIQTIKNAEPLDIAFSDQFLWVLSPSPQCISAWSWQEGGNKFIPEESSKVKSCLKLLVKELSTILQSSHIDLSILYKKLEMNDVKEMQRPKMCKKIKTDCHIKKE